MSTKIYDGFRFVPSDLTEIHSMLMGYRPVVEAAAYEAERRFIAVKAADLIDRASLGSAEPVDCPMTDALLALSERQAEIKKTGRRDFAVDFDFNLMVMPFEGCTYGIIYCDRREWKDAFLALPWVCPWPYWNNADGPEDVTPEAWDARGETWSRLLKQDAWDRPVGCGFGYDFAPPRRVARAQDVLPYVPSRPQRAQLLARDSVACAEYEKLRASEPEDINLGAAMRLMFRADTNMRSEAGDALRAAEAERIAALLPDITEDILLGRQPANVGEETL